VPIPRRLVAVVAVALLLAGCMTSADVITGKTWTLARVDGQPAAAPATLVLGGDGQLQVEPGCNHGGGAYSIEGNQLRIEPIALTAMLCLDDAVNRQEQQVMAVLGADPTFAVDTKTGQLRLTAADATLLFDAP
jgi:heat shock protein HslJ